MKHSKWIMLLMVLFLSAVVSIAAFSCGDDDDDDDDDTVVDDDDDDSEDDDDAADDDDAVDDDDDAVDDDDDVVDDDDDAVDPYTFGGYATDFLTDSLLPNTTIEILQNDSGDPYDPPITGTTNAEGYVEFDLTDIFGSKDDAFVCIKFTRNGYWPTHQYSFTVGTDDNTFLGVSETAVNLMTSGMGLDIDIEAGQGHASGAVYWDDAGTREGIGCATVSYDPDPFAGATDGGIFYFGGQLPDRTTPHTNPENGYFVAINADSGGPYTVTGDADGNEESVSLPNNFPDAVTIMNVLYSKTDYPTKPEEAGCTIAK